MSEWVLLPSDREKAVVRTFAMKNPSMGNLLGDFETYDLLAMSYEQFCDVLNRCSDMHRAIADLLNPDSVIND